MQFEGGDLAGPGQPSRVGKHWIGVVMALVLYLHSPDPARRRVRQILLEEDLSGIARGTDPVDPALAGHDPVGEMGEQKWRDLDVVADHLCLGRAGRGVDHLVGIGQAQPMTRDRDGLGCVVVRHRWSSRPHCSTASVIPVPIAPKRAHRRANLR